MFSILKETHVLNVLTSSDKIVGILVVRSLGDQPLNSLHVYPQTKEL